MAELGKILLIYVVGMSVRKNRQVKNCCGIEKESVSGNCKDGFMSK